MIPQISFDKEVYFPGEEVTGKAWIHTKKDRSCRKVTIKFVARTVGDWETNPKSGKDGHIENENPIPKAKENHIEMIHEVWTAEDGENNFAAGEYDWNFSFELPKDCYPSYEFRYGHIRYFVELAMDIPMFVDTIVAKAVTVSPVHDLLQYPNAREVVRCQTEEDLVLCKCITWKQGKMLFTLNLPKTGYVAGEKISVTGLVENHGRKPVEKLKCDLIRKTYILEGYAKEGKTIYRRNPEKPGYDLRNGKLDQEAFGSVEETVRIPAAADKEFNFEITIPSVVSTIRNNPVLSVEYFVRVTAIIDSVTVKNVYGEAPIIIGNVPLLAPGSTDVPPHTFEPSVRGELDTKCWINRFDDGVFVPKFPVYANLPIYRN